MKIENNLFTYILYKKPEKYIIIAKKKIGKAVFRNKCKRRLRAALRYINIINKIVFILKPSIYDIDFKILLGIIKSMKIN